MMKIPKKLYNIILDPIINKSTSNLIVDSLQYLTIVKILEKELKFLINDSNTLFKVLAYLKLTNLSTKKLILLASIFKKIKVADICQKYRLFYLTDIFYYSILRYLTKWLYHELVSKTNWLCLYCGNHYYFELHEYNNTDLRRIIPIGGTLPIKWYGFRSCCWDCYDLKNK